MPSADRLHPEEGFFKSRSVLKSAERETCHDQGHGVIVQLAESDVNMMRREKSSDHTSGRAIMFASSFFAMMHSA